MRFALLVFTVLSACKTANPNVCCATEAQCADLGVDDLRPCKAGQACDAEFTCVASECSDSSQCTSPDAPVCINNLCVASCAVDADCDGSPGGPLCADDGVCVGCKSSADCSGDAPFCDTEDRACRGCERDSECTGGVCLEADAVCVPDAEVMFLTFEGTDTGDCPRGSPCKTIEYALTRRNAVGPTIHIDGGRLTVGAATLDVNGIYLDGTNTVIGGGNTASIFRVGELGFGASGIVVPAGVDTAITSSGQLATVRLSDVTLSSPVTISAGALDIDKSRIASVNCSDGTLTVRQSEIIEGKIEAMRCQIEVSRNRFQNRQRRGLPGNGWLSDEQRDGRVAAADSAILGWCVTPTCIASFWGLRSRGPSTASSST